jgi:hypothetical protein
MSIPRVVNFSQASMKSRSTTSLLSVSDYSIAESSRSYLSREGLDKKKSKLKTRSGGATLFATFKDKFSFGKSKSEAEPAEENSFRHAWFQDLPKETETLLHQLLRTAEDETRGQSGMKWEQFVKVRLFDSFAQIFADRNSEAFDRSWLHNRS